MKVPDTLVPGPWRLARGYSTNVMGQLLSVPILDAEGFPVAEVDATPILHNWHKRYPQFQHWADGADDGLTQRERPIEQVLSTARVMVVAPELLRELIRMVGVAERIGWPESLQTPRRLIAEATGVRHVAITRVRHGDI